MDEGSPKGVRGAASWAALTLGVAVILGLLVKPVLGIDPMENRDIIWVLLLVSIAIIAAASVVRGWVGRRRR